jgi:hypothetical protein
MTSQILLVQNWRQDIVVNPVEFVVLCFALSVPALYISKFIERTVGERNIFVRILVNALVLSAIFMLLPADIVSRLLSTLPGALACALFFNTQRWT